MKADRADVKVRTRRRNGKREIVSWRISQPFASKLTQAQIEAMAAKLSASEWFDDEDEFDRLWDESVVTNSP